MSNRGFDHGQELAQRTAKEQIKFVIANLKYLQRLRNGSNLINTAHQFKGMTERNIRLTPNQLSFVDGLYEKVFKAAGYDSVNLHIDKKRKGLRY